MDKLFPVLLVAGGGAAGAVTRYLVTLAVAGFSQAFPLGTFLANAAGCFLMGAVYALSADFPVLSREMRLLLATGFCGGFTTMSSFIAELDQLLRRGEWLGGTGYFLATLLGSFAAFLAGAFLVRLFLKT